jgi:hypothetical protein
MFAIVTGNRLDDLREPWTPETIIRRIIGSTVKRLSVRCQEHRQRPTAADSEHLYNILVDLVQVWALLAVDLDIHKVLIHERSDRRVFEGFMLHYMTPMASRVADAEQNGFVLCLGFRQGFLAPCIPIHRIMGMLEEVRASLMN